jgi:hypothetical protein
MGSPGGMFMDLLGDDAPDAFLNDGPESPESGNERPFKMKNGLKIKGQWTQEEDAQLMR